MERLARAVAPTKKDRLENTKTEQIAIDSFTNLPLLFATFVAQWSNTQPDAASIREKYGESRLKPALSPD